MKNTFFSLRFLLSTFVIASIYIISITYSMNSTLVRDTIIGSFPLKYKFDLLFALLQGMWTAMSISGLILSLLTAVLTGANLTLLWQKITVMHNVKNMHIVVGGNSLLGVIGSGCASCGLPILSLLGLSGSVVYLPLKGVELAYIAVILLSLSLFSLIRSKERVCRIIG